MLTPLLKWPGGKTRELRQLAPFLERRWEHFVEPFVGGGACFFSVAPERGTINDVNTSLIGLYRAVQRSDEQLLSILQEMAVLWDTSLRSLAIETSPSLIADFRRRRGALDESAVRKTITDSIDTQLRRFCSTCSLSFVDGSRLQQLFVKSVDSKLRRVYRLEQKQALTFADEKLAQHFETALRTGFYQYLRDEVAGTDALVDLACFYFIRQYCYGSMFRFNRQGKFNIPYGGIAYNRVCFNRKVAALFDDARQGLLTRTEITNEDFRTFFSKRSRCWGRETFVFLDPPYDSQFSEYDQCSFSMDDQRALAEMVGRLSAAFVLVIKDTPAIRQLYQRRQQLNPAIVIDEYAKTYTYNVRGRNERRVTHLLIHNCH